MPESYFGLLIPDDLKGLVDLALDLRWSWNHAADKLWRKISPELWDRTGNPWLILQSLSGARLRELTKDPGLRELMEESVVEHRETQELPGWFQQNYSGKPFSIAYFSMEYGLSEALPLYSGGLGILAGDYLKTASDLGVPVTGVGLLYQQGYFRQVIDAQGEQTEFYPYHDPYQLPLTSVRDSNDDWLRIRLEFPGRTLWLRCWEARVGRVKLYLLDSNDPNNEPPDQGITSELYGGGPELRLQQEIVLGIGGWRLLEALNLSPEICHLNEGHAALAVIERARAFMVNHKVSFEVALAATRPGNIFTTHTPVEAGFDHFARELVGRYLSDYAEGLGIGLQGLADLGCPGTANPQEPLNMAIMATRGSGTVNAVSRLHAEVSRRIFQLLYPRWPEREVPMTSVTNGVHVPSWDSASADEDWTMACGKGRWLSTLDTVKEDFRKIPDETLWEMRMKQTRQLLVYVRARLLRQMASARSMPGLAAQYGQALDPDVLTVGFARRFTGYKRPNLLLKDPERLAKIINHPQRPVQLVIAGKAHPADEEGKELVKAWWQFSIRPDVRGRVVFLSDYDMGLAEQMVQGVDLWVNTPLRPWEACGTSGMKVLVNGGLNVSTLDGWWAEAYRTEVGWAIGDGLVHNDRLDWDACEAEEFYRLLENDVIPCFYERSSKGIPGRWVTKMRASMADLTPQFSANRMVREYVDKLYAGAAERFRKRSAENAREAVQLCRWRNTLVEDWPKLRFGGLDVQTKDGGYEITVTVYLDDLDAKAVQVQLYADPPHGKGQPEIHVMEAAGTEAGTAAGYLYRARISSKRPPEHYTPRVVPYFDGAAVPLEANRILWYQR
ncbi:MAG TPA: alpha-glucan family phosphorylase [Dehalococcoidales bacterium]|nr:alpha-glucan family phosphorylase [Dehalococcoidales bacterium]